MFKTLDFKKIKYVLMDIEGTTSDIHFVKEVLFPYSARELRNYVSQNKNNPKVRECLKSTSTPTDEAAIVQLLEWISNDVKHPALKTLQGYIWERGYKDGTYKSHMYEDVLPAINSWHAAGLKLGIYSSGSVPAQKLFFAHTIYGDICNLLSDHFDLATGGKREAVSYNKIADSLKLPAAEILFLSDIPEELDAASAALLNVAHVVRPGTAPSPNYKSYSTFTEL